MCVIKMEKRKILRGVICVLLGGVCWGFSGTVGQYLFTYKGIDSQWLTIVRMFLAGVLLLAAGYIKTPAAITGIWHKKRDALQLILFAVLGLMVCQYTYFTAIFYSNSGTATVLQYLGQALILGYVCIRMRRLPTKKESVAVFLALGGVFLMATHGNPATLALSKEALFWGIGAAVGLMLYTLLPGNLIAKFGSPVCTGYGMLLGGSALFVLVKGWRLSARLDPGAVAGIAVIAVIGTAVAFSLYLQGVSDLGGVKASLLACIEPVSATLLSALWLGTAFSREDILAFVLIIGMVVLLAVPEKKS